MTSPPLLVPARFNGPPDSANGGWFSGLVAGLLPDSAAVGVRLHSPPPIDTPLRVSFADDDAVGPLLGVLDGDLRIASVSPLSRPCGEVHPAVSVALAQANGAAYEGLHGHPFPTCFSCGTARPDGLNLRPARVPHGQGGYAAAWIPTEVTPEIVWAALDCPGGWSAGIAGRPMVLGTMVSALDALPVVGEDCVVMAWPRGGAGRKHFSGSALYAADGRLLARAEAVWIAVDPSSVRPR